MTDQEKKLIIEEKTENLLRQMTLKEKIGQLNQMGTTMICALPGFEPDVDRWVTQMMNGEITKEELDRRLAMCKEDLREKEVAAGEQGSFINLYDDEKVAYVQNVAVNRSRLGIPLFIGVDVIRGYRTMFPTPLAMASSWDMDVIRNMTKVAKREAYVSGVNWTFGPMLDIARDGRWGRIVESPGEDPLIASRIAETEVKEFQREEEDGCRLMASAKHFIAYGAVSGGQDYNTVDMSKRMLREVYLPPFCAAIRAGAGAVMSAFHDLNGVPCTMDKWLLTDLLRDELKFDGFVVSDAEAVRQCVVHGAVRDEKEAARMTILAGGDMDMSSQVFSRYLEELVREGQLDESVIDKAAGRVLKKKFEFGLFERGADFDREKAARTILSPENRKVSRECAKRSAVLLKNSGVLPIGGKVKNILITGKLADDREELSGPWSFTGNPETLVTIVEGMKNGAPKGTMVEYVPGFDTGDDTSGFAEAYEKASRADLVIAVAGEKAFMSGEAASRASLGLSGKQEEFLAGLAGLGVPVVVVLVNGRPLSIGSLKENPGIGGILESWHLGTEFGNAVADILFGKYNPSGKLTVTFANAGGQEPMYYNHPNTGKPGSDFKFTSKYLDVPIEPLYPFGYGLSYTTFDYSNLQLESAVLGTGGSLRGAVDVTNSGTVAGEEIVQIYIRDVAASCVRPVKELKDFVKVMIRPGETKKVAFEIPVSEMGFYTRDCEYVVEPGEFRLFAGKNSAEVLETSFEVRA